MERPVILFVANAGPEVGGGHVMRSLTLARALAERGGQPLWLASPEVDAVLDAFAGKDMARLPAASSAPAALAKAAAGAAFDAVVFDHYGLSAAEHRDIARGKPVLVIDDLADRPLGADLLADFSPARTPADYAGLVGAETRLLLGPAYALVRPEFTALRDEALARRGANETVARIQVSLGLTDVEGITARVVHRLLPRLGDAHLDVVLGAGAPSRAAIEALAARDPRVRAFVQVRDIAPLTAGADLAIGAGGSSTWERAVLGLPTVMLVLADNQVPASEAVARLGAAELVDARAPDFEAAFDRAFTGLMRSPDRRARMSAAAAKLCDGLGAGRVAEALLARL